MFSYFILISAASVIFFVLSILIITNTFIFIFSCSIIMLSCVFIYCFILITIFIVIFVILSNVIITKLFLLLFLAVLNLGWSFFAAFVDWYKLTDGQYWSKQVTVFFFFLDKGCEKGFKIYLLSLLIHFIQWKFTYYLLDSFFAFKSPFIASNALEQLYFFLGIEIYTSCAILLGKNSGRLVHHFLQQFTSFHLCSL